MVPACSVRFDEGEKMKTHSFRHTYIYVHVTVGQKKLKMNLEKSRGEVAAQHCTYT